MQTSRFTERNEGFTCIVCGYAAPPHPSSSRDHCPRCLNGLHVDINPGDRSNECEGILEPIGLQTKGGKSKIVYRCRKCRERVFNLVAPDDSTELIAGLSARPW